MSFGFGVGDIAAAISLAHTVYKKCRDSPNQYKELASDAQQLANVLEDLDDLVKECKLKPNKERRLLEYGGACHKTLDDANNMLEKYKNMSARARGVVDRLGWDYEDARDIRNRMTNDKTSLTAFYSNLTMSEFVQMQKTFASYLDEVRKGHRDTDSVVLIATEDESNESSAWPVLIKELEEFGLTSDVVNRNHQFIVELIRTAFNDGRLENISISGDDLSRALENVSISQHNFRDPSITDRDTNASNFKTQANSSRENYVSGEINKLKEYQREVVEKAAPTEDISSEFSADTTIYDNASLLSETMAPPLHSKTVAFSTPDQPTRTSHTSQAVQTGPASEWSETQSMISSMSTVRAFRHSRPLAPGLNFSIIEAVSVWLKFGKVTKAAILGEVALSYVTTSSNELSTEAKIRLENVHELASIAPNPSCIMQTPNEKESWEYNVDLSRLAGTEDAPTIAFKYQVGLYEDSVETQAPIILIPQWKSEESQISVILQYTLNPVFKKPITLSDVTISIRLEVNESGAGQATTARSKPAGTFSRLHNMVWWQFGQLSLKPDAPDRPILARLATSGQAKPGKVEAKWTLASEPSHDLGIGSRLNISKLDTKGTPWDTSPERSWASVASSLKVVSGNYVAT